jgi:hypothetical protein
VFAQHQYLWEYSNPTNTLWMPFPPKLQHRLNAWMYRVKIEDDTRVARNAQAPLVGATTPAASLRTRSVVAESSKSSASLPAYDEAYQYCFRAHLPGVHAHHDHVIYVGAKELTMTSWL